MTETIERHLFGIRAQMGPDRSGRQRIMATAKRPPLIAAYDRGVDVLHVALGTPVPAEGEGRQGGIELRYALADDHPCGATIIGFRRNAWPIRLDRLCGIIVDHLHVPSEDVKGVIAKALS